MTVKPSSRNLTVRLLSSITEYHHSIRKNNSKREFRENKTHNVLFAFHKRFVCF